MQGIGNFLKRYLDFTSPTLVRTRAVSKAVGEKFNIECDERLVSVRGDIAFIQMSGALKSEIALHKKALLTRINELGGGSLADLK